MNSENKVNVRNLMVQNGKITGIGYIPDEDEENIDIIDISQSLVLPNNFDFLHAPLFGDLTQYIDDVQSHGVFNLALIPNNMTTLFDNPTSIEKFLSMSPDVGSLQVIASATKGNLPNELSELSLLHQAGASGIYLGRIIENEPLLKQALTYIDMIGCPIVVGPMTQLIADGAHLNEGCVSFKIGVRGESIDDEFLRVKNLLALIERHTRVPVHFLSVSSSKAVDYIDQFKQRHPQISVGVSPFHLILSDDELFEYNVDLKFNPPLRSKQDLFLLLHEFKSEKIDHLTSLHAPMAQESQPKPFFDALPLTQTLPYYFNMASHLLTNAEFSLDKMASFFNAPKAFLNFSINELSLHDSASFVALKNHSKTKENVSIFSGIDVELTGGIDLLMLNGNLK